MMIIDLDSLKGNKQAKAAVAMIVSRKLVERKLASGEPVFVATTPIYWLSKLKVTIDDVHAEGFPKIGTSLGVKSVIEAIREMVKEIDRVALSMGLKAQGRFRRPVEVVTDKDFLEIELLGATPIPTALFNFE